MKTKDRTYENYRSLMEIAIDRGGLFTRTEAVECGYYPQNLGPMVKSGKIEKLSHGLYRLTDVPKSKFFDLVALSMWGRGRSGSGDTSSVVISHASALAFHQLGDFMPRRPADVTILNGVKIVTRSPVPMRKHQDIGFSGELTEWRDGFRVSSPLRALIETFNLGSYELESIYAAAEDAIQREMIDRSQLEKYKMFIPNDLMVKLTSFYSQFNGEAS